MIALLLFIRQSRLKSAEQLTEFKQKLFRSQMNPHFIFNSLTSIQNFIINQDDIKASVYLSRFSELVRSILNNSMVENITLEEEVSTIKNYLELQKVRFSEKFDFSVGVDSNIDPENTFIPPMLGQPFIENAIEHGIKNKAGKGHIRILFEAKDARLHYSIEDDGVGRQKAREILNERNKEHRSVATDITKERIRVLNRKQRSKITLDIDDLMDRNGFASGTRVTFTVALPDHPPRA
jgi:sensor histidine kinase YesM